MRALICLFFSGLLSLALGNSPDTSHALELESLNEEVLSLKKLLAEQTAVNNALKDSVMKLMTKVDDLQTSIESNERAQSYMARTCHELMNADPTLESGLYYIDPDGWNTGDVPIQVHCSKLGQTSVNHDSEMKTSVGHCYDPGCYSRSVNYYASMRQMRALMDLSQNCEQFIRYDCFIAVLEQDGIQYGWWNDRNGSPHYYWDGSNDTVHTCACGIAGNCIETSKRCNCDSGAPDAFYDEGYIRKQEHLPITRLNFGRTSSTYSSGSHTLGPLVCSGNSQVESNTKPRSCTDLWRSGNTMSGFYLVQPEGERINTVYCDFTKLPGDEGQESFVGVTDVKSSLIHFHVTRSSSYTFYTPRPIPYDTTILNIGNAINLETGVFTAPLKGIYTFTFGFGSTSTYPWVPLYHNNRIVSSSFLTIEVPFDSASTSATLALEIGDTVAAYMMQSTIFSSPNNHVYFIGSLLQQL